jgi:hypothetical protein
MIDKADAMGIFKININRTDMLIDAIGRIKAYNDIYQQKILMDEPHFLSAVRDVQNERLKEIENSCAEHAIISLATVFETYYKELLQELIFEIPNYFVSKTNRHTNSVRSLIESDELYAYEDIERRLRLRSRNDYYNLFRDFDIPFILDSEKERIEEVYAFRNHFVHNANRIDTRADSRLSLINLSAKGKDVVARAKILRTIISQMIPRIDKRVKRTVIR